jgi:type III pantothenate kinase
MSNRSIGDPGQKPPQRLRIVADLGNSRLKWGRLDDDGQLTDVVALPVDDPSRWEQAWERWRHLDPGESSWRIASVNPPVATRLSQFLRSKHKIISICYQSANDVPIAHALENPETAGADRALAVLGAKALNPARSPGLVVLCGTAITVERIDAEGIWQGGAIAPGLTLSARAMHLLTAQLPLIEPVADPPPWGRSTVPAIRAGVYWGVVGAVRELLTRQSAGLGAKPWVVFSGGDAKVLRDSVGWQDAQLVLDLVLHGLALIGSRE